MQIKCMKCHGKTERHERMMDLTVEIEGEIGTLEEALRRFTGTEVLDGENKYKCSRLFRLNFFKKLFRYRINIVMQRELRVNFYRDNFILKILYRFLFFFVTLVFQIG